MKIATESSLFAESRETSQYYVLSAVTFDAYALTALIRSQQNRMHLVPLSLSLSLSLLYSARYFSLSTELIENVTSAALERKNHAIGEIWKYLCERSEKSNTKNHKK